MAMRLLVSICCIVTSSAGGVFSESQFNNKYLDYVLDMDVTSVKNANANIIGEALPSNQKEIDMNRWYHDVNAEVQSDAKAAMGKAVADKSSGLHPTFDCLALIKKAMPNPSATFAADNLVYLSIVGDDIRADGDNKNAQDCVNALSGPEKELAIKVGMRSGLFGYFDTEWKKQVKAALAAEPTKGVAVVSELVTGTLGATAGEATDKWKDTQPMYLKTDATLRSEMMIAMVNQLKANLPPVV